MIKAIPTADMQDELDEVSGKEKGDEEDDEAKGWCEGPE